MVMNMIKIILFKDIGVTFLLILILYITLDIRQKVIAFIEKCKKECDKND